MGLGDRTFTQVFNDSRAVHMLNDVAANVYTDNVLLPVGAFVMGEIQDEFAKNDIPSKETTGDVVYTTPDDTIDLTTLDDFQLPLELWERGTDGGLWIPMDRVNILSPATPTLPQFLGNWEWSDETLKVVPASDDRQVKIRYRRQIPYETDASVDTATSVAYYWALVAGTAYYAMAGTERNDRATQLYPTYTKRLKDAIQVASKDRQTISTRQISGRRRSGWYPIYPGR